MTGLIKAMIASIRSADRTEITYWLGLLMLFAGLSLAVSVATALIVIGALVVLTSTASSFFITWLSAVEKK